MQHWYYTLNGTPQPAVSEEVLKRLIHEGGLSRYEFVWTDGMTKWAPAAKFFDSAFTLQENPNFNPWIYWAIWTLSLVFITVPGMFETKFVFFVFAAPLLRAIGVLGLLIYTPLALRRTYVFGKIATAKGKPVLGRSMRILALALTALLWGCLVASSLVSNLYITRLQHQVKAMTYKIHIGEKAGSFYLVADGSIGRGYAKKVQELLAQQPNIKGLFIHSQGGLLDEALKVASLIEQRRGFSVFAAHECSSACIPILLSADKRIAAPDTKLGFHGATTYVNGRPTHLKNNPQQEKADSYLKKRNITPDIWVNHRFSSGNQEFIYIPAPKLLERGTLNIILADHQVMTSPLKVYAHEIAKATAQKPETYGTYAADLIKTLAKFPPSTQVLSDWGALYDAVQEGKPTPFREKLDRLIQRANSIAFLEAAPDTYLNLFNVEKTHTNNMADLGHWKECAYHSTQTPLPYDMAKLNPEQLNLEYKTLSQLYESALASGHIGQTPKLLTRDEAPLNLLSALAAYKEQAGNNAWGNPSRDEVLCKQTLYGMKLISELPTLPAQVGAIRYMHFSGYR